MSQTAYHSDLLAQRRGNRLAARPFAGLLDAIIVLDPVQFPFNGAIARSHAEAAWTWAYRDLCPDLISAERVESGQLTADEIEPAMAQIIGRMMAGLETAAAEPEKDRRLRATLGSLDARDALPHVITALRNRTLLTKAEAFGQAINSLTTEAQLATALQGMPLRDPPVAALLFQAAMHHIANPTRLVGAVVKLSGNASESAVTRAGFSPVVDAVLSHAQNQYHALQMGGPFADIDLMCRSLERFHRLIRSVTGFIEFTRGSRWAMILSAITKQVSDRMEPRLREVVPDLNLAMRRGREGADRLDEDRLLAAINGVYLLATIRECRDSLALNNAFEQAWSQVGQTLELHVQRNLELIRLNPADANVGARLDAGIKMAEIRFNPEYAATLRRARAAAERRA